MTNGKWTYRLTGRDPNGRYTGVLIDQDGKDDDMPHASLDRHALEHGLQAAVARKNGEPPPSRQRGDSYNSW